ncbi:hypothetical protein M378DRAFT_753006 [Amanita muscaria Koide BX008]|uniref:Uncharacterized protein n=1 Tax=Amanita muscaria (strain Koide BX008) TaxID=946122 RepID=A0A0C2WDC7_AMAMK|nr:hypothetical protein M378DRAFT_753006 [Amanita muscaria Koide BX008]
MSNWRYDAACEPCIAIKSPSSITSISTVQLVEKVGVYAGREEREDRVTWVRRSRKAVAVGPRKLLNECVIVRFSSLCEEMSFTNVVWTICPTSKTQASLMLYAAGA